MTLREYLEKLTTHDIGKCLHIRAREIQGFTPSLYEDESFHSIVIETERDYPRVNDWLSSQFFRILKPGGHISILGSEIEVSHLEKSGMEIRDSIFVAEESSNLFYHPKASKKERELGLESFGEEKVNDGRTTEMDTPYQRGESKRKNIHPTVKAIKVMDWVLGDLGAIGMGQSVLDPFTGSGTTGIACRDRGLAFTGIEISEEYARIAKARIGLPCVLVGDCVEEMAIMEPESFDFIVTDPPYGLKFMAKGWDDLGGGVQQEEWHIRWLRQAIRLLKPGGRIAAFGGTRTFHRLGEAMRRVGFSYDGVWAWVYGSGFPKSHNISKSIDKMNGVAPTVVGSYTLQGTARTLSGANYGQGGHHKNTKDVHHHTVGTSEEAQRWTGWGTALKPAWESICVATKE